LLAARPRRGYDCRSGSQKDETGTDDQLQAALVTYVTAGYPNADSTPDILLGMEAGGAGNATYSGLNNKNMLII